MQDESWTNVSDHHIEGYTSGGDHLKIPLISEILPNLWVGGCIGGCKLPDDFDEVFSMYMWEEYILGPNTSRHTVKMYDSSDEPNVAEVDAIAAKVRHAWEVEGKKVLVHCQAGLNRSNLVTARMLSAHTDPGKRYSADEAIALLREKRHPYVLCNTTFENWLRKEVPCATV